MRAGLLRHRLRLERAPATPTRSATGAEVEVPVVVATVAASIQPATARELLRGEQMVADVTHVIGMRYLAGLSPKMWGVYDGRRFDFIQVIDVDERHRELQVLAKEVVR